MCVTFQVLNDSNYKLKGIILIAQMSTSGSLTDESYIESSEIF